MIKSTFICIDMKINSDSVKAGKLVRYNVKTSDRTRWSVVAGNLPVRDGTG